MGKALPHCSTMFKMICILALISMSTAMVVREENKESVQNKTRSFNPNIKSEFCGECIEVTVSSSGGALEYHAEKLGRFMVSGSIWTDTVPIFESENGHFLTMDQYSDPNRFYYKWDICDNAGGTDPGITNEYYSAGLNCPWEIPDQWLYNLNGEWYDDETLTITCSQWR